MHAANPARREDPHARSRRNRHRCRDRRAAVHALGDRSSQIASAQLAPLDPRIAVRQPSDLRLRQTDMDPPLDHANRRRDRAAFADERLARQRQLKRVRRG